MRFLIGLIFSLLIVTNSFAAGSCKAFLSQGFLTYKDKMMQVDVECIGDASDGTVPSITIPFKETTDSATVFGFEKGYTLAGRFLYSVETDPVTQPVTAYTVTFTTDNDSPVWALAARSTTAKEVAYVLSDKAAPPAMRRPLKIQLGTLGTSERVILRILFGSF